MIWIAPGVVTLHAIHRWVYGSVRKHARNLCKGSSCWPGLRSTLRQIRDYTTTAHAVEQVMAAANLFRILGQGRASTWNLSEYLQVEYLQLST